MKSYSIARALTATLLLVGGIANLADGQTLRIVNYNVDADTGGSTGQMGGTDGGPGLASVLEAIGQEHLSNGNVQPIDVLALEELDYNGGSTWTSFRRLHSGGGAAPSAACTPTAPIWSPG